MSDTIDIVIADDHPLFRAGVKQTLEEVDYMNVIGEAGDGASALELIRDKQPHIPVLDVQMPIMNGLEIVLTIDEEQLPTKVLLLTMFKNRNYFYQAVSHGAKGYVLKETALNDLIDAINDVHGGRTFISQSLLSMMNAKGKQKYDGRVMSVSLESLTGMERTILKKIADWKTNNEIAAELSISPRTVGSHRNHISEKLHLHGAHSLISFAIENRELF